MRRTVWLLLLLTVGAAGHLLMAQDTEAEVRLPDVIYGSEPELANNILITIDDCLDEDYTRKLFTLLHERGIKAVFFPNTVNILKHDPELWREIAAAGFEIGYHTRSHQEGMNQEELAEDFALFQAEIRQILDDPAYTIRFVRPPYGIWDENWLTWAHDNGLHTVRWNLVTRAGLKMYYVQAVLNNRDQGGSIFLLHPRLTDFSWMEANLDALMALQNSAGESYIFTIPTEAFDD